MIVREVDESPVAKVLRQYSPTILSKARALISSDMAIIARDRKHPSRWYVYPEGMAERKYTVAIVENRDEDWVMAMCSCPNGNKQGEQGKCYHKAAVLAKMWGEEI